MALSKRYTTAPKAGTIAAFLLVLIFGSPFYFDWVKDNISFDTAGGWWLHLLSTPRWAFAADESVDSLVAAIVRDLFLIGLTALFLYLLPGSQLARARGTVSQFFAGWAAFIFAAAFATMIGYWFRNDPTLLKSFEDGMDGVAYGFFVGWIVGLAALGGRRGTR
jgi:hypothetical protein